jgi:T5SS/PEP-CTERM-associated repeat protein
MRLISAALAVATMVGFLSAPAEVFAQFGDVDVFGNVVLSDDATLPDYGFYYDNPTTLDDEGTIPESGNRIDPFLGTAQVEYEGRVVGTSNVNFDIVVGRTASGQLLLNGAQLNDQNLILGDQGVVGSILRRGTGVMRIEGFGALYNNDPTILPVPLIASPSVAPRVATIGYDMWVGRSGTGVLELILGGQAQIQDVVYVGEDSGSIGDILIDGFDSFLQSGGFLQAGSTDPNEVDYMVVGRWGSGTMTIRNGGQSYNAARSVTTGDTEGFGAVVGAAFAADDSSPPGIGGTGLVTVDGLLSKWTVGGTLQIGAFHNNRVGIGPLAEEDLEGELAEYGSGIGHGTLRVTNGGLVSIVPPPLEDPSDVPNRLDFLVGRFGTVELDGGRIELLDVVDPSSTSTNPLPQLDNGRLINDGVV